MEGSQQITTTPHVEAEAGPFFRSEQLVPVCDQDFWHTMMLDYFSYKYLDEVSDRHCFPYGNIMGHFGQFVDDDKD